MLLETVRQNKADFMDKITKDILITDLFAEHAIARVVFMQHGMMCAGCAQRKTETIEMGAKMHGVDLDKLLSDLNRLV